MKIRELQREAYRVVLNQVRTEQDALTDFDPWELEEAKTKKLGSTAAVSVRPNARGKAREDRHGLCVLPQEADTVVKATNLLHAACAELHSRLGEVGEACGTTFVGCTRLNHQLLTLHVGDSGAAMIYADAQDQIQLQHLTQEQQFFNYYEYNRIIQAGGMFVWRGEDAQEQFLKQVFDKELSFTQHAVAVADIKKLISSEEILQCDPVPRLVSETGAMQMTRALGDTSIGNGMSAEPVFSLTHLPNHPGFLIIASDGLWDAISAQTLKELFALAKQKGELNAESFAAELNEAAAARFNTDDITILVVPLYKMPQQTFFYVMDGHAGFQVADRCQCQLRRVVNHVQAASYYEDNELEMMNFYAFADEIYQLVFQQTPAHILDLAEFVEALLQYEQRLERKEKVEPLQSLFEKFEKQLACCEKFKILAERLLMVEKKMHPVAQPLSGCKVAFMQAENKSNSASTEGKSSFKPGARL